MRESVFEDMVRCTLVCSTIGFSGFAIESDPTLMV